MADPEPTELDTRRPFTRADAAAAGLDMRLLRGSRFRRIFNGVYVEAGLPLSPQLRSKAALAPFTRTAFASHASAARIHDVPIPTIADEHVGVLEKRDRRNRPGIRCHVNREPKIRTVDGYRVSDYDQMFVELAALLDFVDLVVVGDNLVRKSRLTPRELVDHCQGSSLPGARRALTAARHVRTDVDSPMETRLRMLIVLAGLPEPQVNLTIRDVDGEPLRRYDLSYPAVRVIVEYDGRHHRERKEQWESDLERREAIDDDGWRILVITSQGIYRHPLRTLQRIHRALLSRKLAGTPRRLGDDWRPHFPGYAG